MPIESKTQLKTYFQTGDVPTENQYSTLIDSLVHVWDQQTVVSMVCDPAIAISGNLGKLVTKDSDGLCRIAEKEVFGAASGGEIVFEILTTPSIPAGAIWNLSFNSTLSAGDQIRFFNTVFTMSNSGKKYDIPTAGILATQLTNIAAALQNWSDTIGIPFSVNYSSGELVFNWTDAVGIFGPRVTDKGGNEINIGGVEYGVDVEFNTVDPLNGVLVTSAGQQITNWTQKELTDPFLSLFGVTISLADILQNIVAVSSIFKGYNWTNNETDFADAIETTLTGLSADLSFSRTGNEFTVSAVTYGTLVNYLDWDFNSESVNRTNATCSISNNIAPNPDNSAFTAVRGAIVGPLISFRDANTANVLAANIVPLKYVGTAGTTTESVIKDNVIESIGDFLDLYCLAGDSGGVVTLREHFTSLSGIIPCNETAMLDLNYQLFCPLAILSTDQIGLFRRVDGFPKALFAVLPG